jgi:NAD(P)-dependent dehydrogenase (short-subunit alcohol dehydrogenase family)
MEIRNSVVLITGASAGIGLATARRFAAEGARVVLAARSADALERTAEELRREGKEALAVRTDMTSRADVERLAHVAYEHFGRIDILINNAGQAAAGTIADVEADHYRRIIELNLFGPLYAMQAVIPLMRQGGGGLIINISSMVSKMHIPGLGTYASTKAALNMLSDTARGELEPDNIRVITVYPRMTATDFGKNSLGNESMRRQQRRGAPIPTDSTELVAEKILEAASKEPTEQYMDS